MMMKHFEPFRHTNRPTYLSTESGVFLRGGGRNLVFLEEVGGSLSTGGGGGSKPGGGGRGEQGPAWEENDW